MEIYLPTSKHLTLFVVLSFLIFSLTGCSKEQDVWINVLSFNMKFQSEAGSGDPVYSWEIRLPGIVKSFSDYDVDIVGTQELRKWQLDELMD